MREIAGSAKVQGFAFACWVADDSRRFLAHSPFRRRRAAEMVIDL